MSAFTLMGIFLLSAAAAMAAPFLIAYWFGKRRR